MLKYDALKKVQDHYLLSNSAVGAVSLLNGVELILFNLYQPEDDAPMKTFLLQMGVSAETLEERVAAFGDRIEKDGWLREQYPPSHGVFFSSVYLNVTSACNFRCAYCYLGKGEGSKQAEGQMAIGDAKTLIRKIRKMNQACLVIVSGGEPFMHPDIMRICQMIEAAGLSFSILTNGALIDAAHAAQLATFRHLRNVQISLDGISEATHNLTRGKTFRKTRRGIETAIQFGLPFSLAPTMHEGNLHELSDIAIYALSQQGGFTPNNLRQFPHCKAEGFSLKEEHFLKTLNQIEDDLLAHFDAAYILEQKSRSSVHQASQRNHFICGTAHAVFDIGWDGSLYPCHLLKEEKFKLGNLLEDDGETIKANVLKLAIRKKTCEIEKCKTCSFMSLCGGGCKAAAYYHTGRFDREDPLCAVLYDNQIQNLTKALND